jgi:hypothetical protein
MRNEPVAEVVGITNYIPISDEALLKANGIYLCPRTHRKYHSQGIYPELYLKIGHKVFLDLTKWAQIVEEAKSKRDERVTRLYQVANEKLKSEVAK